MYTLNHSDQLCELSTNDLNFLVNDGKIENELEDNAHASGQSTVRDLDNILDKFDADPRILLENPNQLLNCKYYKYYIDNYYAIVGLNSRGLFLQKQVANF